ncbi:MAG TPA: XdhC/CoxI family protein [Steroidobacteraceae bacterium]|nr:XdhC/CoxI family protein [Steroidobacteraceae bacterium]
MPTVRVDTGLEALVERHRLLAGPCALATIVATAGSTYRKAGARMLIEADGRITGLLSGGCLEQDLRERTRAVLDTQLAAVVEYDMRSSDDLIFGIGAGCEGAMRILVEPAPRGGAAATALEHASLLTRSGRGAALAVVHEGPVAALGTRVWPTAGPVPLEPALAGCCAEVVATETSQSLRYHDGDTPIEAWIQYLAPPPRVLVCGAGPDAEPLVALLGTLGFPVTVVDHRPAYASQARFPHAAVVLGPAAALARDVDLGGFVAAVVMSHHLASDAHYLRALAASPVPYVGLLGPRPRRERLLGELGAAGEALGPRLRGPVGLDIGAVTPEAIALAIAAELHAVAAGHGGGPYGRPWRLP